MIPTLAALVPLSVAVAAPPTPVDNPADAVRASANLLASELTVGQRYEIAVELELEDGTSLSDAGVPAPFLQLDVPAGVELEGKVLDSYRDLARNGFVNAPYERMLSELPAKIAFTLTDTPAKDATIGMNIVGYVTNAAGEQGFLRRRLELPLEAGAAALEVPATRSTWGKDETRLQIGQSVKELVLPRADGSELALSSLLGEKNLLLVTYRAHW